MQIHLSKFGQAKPLVFFHGWGFNSQVWLSLVDELKTDYQLILVDLPGFGLSSFMNWTTFKTKLLAQLPQQFTVIGWSMGGLYATRLALEAQTRVSHLINICSSPRFVASENWPGVSAKVLEQFYHRLAQDAEGTLRDFVALQARTKADDLIEHIPSTEALASGLLTLKDWDLRDALMNLETPASYLFGRLDPITPVKTMYNMQIAYSHFNYVLFKRSAHMPFLSEKNLFIETLTGLIQ